MQQEPNSESSRRQKRPNNTKTLLLILGAAFLLGVLILLAVNLLRGPTPLTAPAGEPSETAPVTEPSETGSETVPETEAPTDDGTVSFMALGDNLMHTVVMEAGLQPDGTYDFHDFYRYIKDEVQNTDIACINQETIFIDDPSQFSGYPIFGGPKEVGIALLDTGFDVFTQATNHCYDKFSVGIHDTLAFWRQHPEATVTGIHDSQEDADQIRVVERKGIKIAMLNYTYGTNMGDPAEAYEIDFLDKAKVAADIAKAKQQADLVLVFPHWGTENTFEPDSYQREWGQYLVDQGADAVIGCHPHTLQPLEILTDKNGKQVPVFWSMGNFISHMLGNQNMLGGMARLTFVKDENGAKVQDWELVPTMTFGSEDSGKWEFCGMRLTDYTDEMAKRHFVEDDTSVDTMWALYRSIVGEDGSN